jgi:hypothetical protein
MNSKSTLLLIFMLIFGCSVMGQSLYPEKSIIELDAPAVNVQQFKKIRTAGTLVSFGALAWGGATIYDKVHLPADRNHKNIVNIGTVLGIISIVAGGFILGDVGLK